MEPAVRWRDTGGSYWDCRPLDPLRSPDVDPLQMLGLPRTLFGQLTRSGCSCPRFNVDLAHFSRKSRTVG
jgi:hypothetical protein